MNFVYANFIKINYFLSIANKCQNVTKYKNVYILPYNGKRFLFDLGAQNRKIRSKGGSISRKDMQQAHKSSEKFEKSSEHKTGSSKNSKLEDMIKNAFPKTEKDTNSRSDRVYKPTLKEKLDFGERAERVFKKQNTDIVANTPWKEIEIKDDGTYYDDINVPGEALHHFTDANRYTKQDRAMDRRLVAAKEKKKNATKKKSTWRFDSGQSLTRRQLQIGEKITREIHTVINMQLSLPNCPLEKSGFAIHSIQVSKDLRRAVVAYTCEKKSKELSTFLTNYTPILRYKITPLLGMKYSPEFKFCDLAEYKFPNSVASPRKVMSEEEILERETRRIKWEEKQRRRQELGLTMKRYA